MSAFPQDLLQGLNPEQQQAVTMPAASVLVLAGAGSGKTRVLTTRMAWLIHNGWVSPGGVLAVTFTNKAAKEMLTRLSTLLPMPVRGMWVGTFHGLCHRFLRAHYQLAQLPQTFQILDTQDQLSAVKRLLKAHNVDDERFPPKQVVYFIAGSKEQGLRPKDVLVRDPHTRRMVELYELYEQQCQREGSVDFAELMLRTYELMRDHAALREHYNRRFAYILVDEFQDTNQLQYLWLKLFAGHGTEKAACVMAVGDDDQSIYAFRGAQVGNMRDFESEFAAGQVIKLEQNYRSSGHILDAANDLISHNTQRLGKNLRTDAGAGERVRVFEASSDFQEAIWIMDEMQALFREGIDRQQMAILYRSNAQSRLIETSLFNAGIPYRVYGGLRFFERAEIKHALAYLRLLENPKDDTSYLRVVNFPPRGIGARTLEQLQDVSRIHGQSLFESVPQVPGKAGANLAAFNRKIDELRAKTEHLTLRDIISFMLEASGLIEHYSTEREGQDRIENLNELVNAAESFVTQEGFGRDAVALPLDERADDADIPGPDLMTGETISPLAAFLAHAALESGDNQAQAGQDAVQLMTVHAAKGLEFDAVFLTGLEEGLFPHENALSDAGGVEEERRLMYVAITRARKRLYISFSQTRMLHGQTRYNLRSRFLEELPEEHLKWITPKRQPSAWGASASVPSWQPGAAAFALNNPPTPPVVSTSNGHSICAGQQVFHNKFGEGKVLTVEGSGDDARAHINFNRHGSKWLALAVAKLTPI